MTRTLCEYMEMMRRNSGTDSTLDRIDIFLFPRITLDTWLARKLSLVYFGHSECPPRGSHGQGEPA